MTIAKYSNTRVTANLNKNPNNSAAVSLPRSTARAMYTKNSAIIKSIFHSKPILLNWQRILKINTDSKWVYKSIHDLVFNF